MVDSRPFFQQTLNDLANRLGELGGQPLLRDEWQRPPGGNLEGRGVTCILEGGGLFERAGVAMSDVRGKTLPPAATARNPHLAGKGFEAVGVSLVVHPRNPHLPTAHMNVRSFRTQDGSAWWFGGGFDLTPYFYEPDDEASWHHVCRELCAPYGGDAMYGRFSTECDRYFTLKHRQERRGLGGLFFDDLNEGHPDGGPFERCFSFTQSVASGFMRAYEPIVARRRDTPYSEEDRAWQAWRRSRYVEFNLVWDRGTLFGLQSGGRTESILMSMPPMASWHYGAPRLDERQEALMRRLSVTPPQE